MLPVDKKDGDQGDGGEKQAAKQKAAARGFAGEQIIDRQSGQNCRGKISQKEDAAGGRVGLERQGQAKDETADGIVKGEE